MRLHVLRLSAAALTFFCALRAALAADPTTGECLAASEASLKAANEHHLLAERAQLLVCAASTCPTDIRKECLRRVDEVNTDIPTVVFSARDASGNEVTAVKVTMDGAVLAEQLEGTALPIDPGEHTFTFETAGQPPLTRRFLVVQAQKDRREALVFGEPVGALPATAPETSRKGGLGTQRVLAIVAGAVGVAGVGVGSAFGLIAISDKNDAQRQCPNLCRTQAGVDAWHKAGTMATISTIGFAAGGALVAGGLALWFTAPSTSTQVGLGPTGLQVRGTW
jgi:hypothetical protein